MKYAEMLSSTTSIGSYDKTKTSLFGNVYTKTINSQTCYGPGLSKFLDIQTDFAGAVTLSGMECTTTNGRKFVASSVSAGVLNILLYNFNLSTGVSSAVGRIQMILPNAAATTHTIRSISVVDSGTTGWKIYISTVGSVLINGGMFVANKVDLADFTFNPTPVAFYMALSSDIKATYFIQDPTAIGVSHVMTTMIGAAYNSAANQIISVKGSAASLSHDGFDTSTAPTITSYPCTGATVNASPTFQMTAHPFQANDPVVITANAPGGFTASTQLAAQTVYFVRNPTANTFELSATSGGASINATTAVTPTLVRAFGTSTNTYVNARKTGTIATAFSGTALLLNNIDIVTPTDGANAGTLCFFLPTSTNFYCYPIANISSGATSLPGAIGVNNLGSGTDITTPTTVTAHYSETLGKIIYTTAAFGFIMKGWQNNSITTTFGTQINTWLENNSSTTTAYFRGFVVSGLETRNGWIFATIATVGQRGILCMDARSDARFNYSYMTSPVQLLGAGKLKFVTTLEQLFNVTDTVEVYYRSAATSSDAIFNTDSGSWTQINIADDLSTISIQDYVQVKVMWDVATVLSGIPTQIMNIIIGYTPLSDMSANWLGWNDQTTQNGASPGYAAFLQLLPYTAPVALRFTAYDIVTKTVVAQADTDTDYSSFSKTSNSGTSWSVMTGANDYPNVALTSGVRYNWGGAVPSNVIISWQEK